MAKSTDARASGFDAAAFRDAIEFTMSMAAPNAKAERLKFVIAAENTFSTADKTDPTGTPYDLTAKVEVVTEQQKEIEVPVAMEFESRSSQGRDTSLGYMQPSHAEVYILDTHYEKVKDADYALINGYRYDILNWNPPMGLFEVTIYSCLLEAQDQ